MRKTAIVLSLSLFLLSCSDSDTHNNVSEMFSNLEKADSLCKVDNLFEAKDRLKDVLNVQIQIDYPSPLNKIIWMLSSDLDANKQEGMVYYDYMFSCLAQLDALDKLSSLTDEPLDKINVLKLLFSLFPNLDDVTERYTEWVLQTKGSWAASLSYKSRYDEYINKVQLENKFSASATGLPKYLYRRKWCIIDKLLIELDKTCGYDTTFDFMDSVLVSHGTSLEDYTKCLVKAYMSFSGKALYDYDSGMDYTNFQSITSNQDNWYATWIQHPDINLFGGERILNTQNEGFVVEYDDHIIYNPSLIKYIETLGVWPHKITTMNGTKQMCIELSKGHKYAISNTLVNIDKPLLCALLYKYGHADMVPKILNGKQYRMKETLVREGYEEENKKIVYYDSNLNEIEWRLYSEQGVPVCDSTGTHIYRVYQYSDSTIYCYYGNDSLPRKNNYARLKEENDIRFYYNWQNTLLMKSSGDTCIYYYYKSLDSIQICRAVNYETNNTIVTTEYRNHFGPTLLSQLTQEVAFYNGIYDNSHDIQYGNVIEVHRFSTDGTYYNSSDKWAIEKYCYDGEGRVLEHVFYDSKMYFQGGMKYVYTFNSVEIQYFDKNGKLIKTEVTHL